VSAGPRLEYDQRFGLSCRRRVLSSVHTFFFFPPERVSALFQDWGPLRRQGYRWLPLLTSFARLVGMVAGLFAFSRSRSWRSIAPVFPLFPGLTVIEWFTGVFHLPIKFTDLSDLPILPRSLPYPQVIFFFPTTGLCGIRPAGPSGRGPCSCFVPPEESNLPYYVPRCPRLAS